MICIHLILSIDLYCFWVVSGVVLVAFAASGMKTGDVPVWATHQGAGGAVKEVAEEDGGFFFLTFPILFCFDFDPKVF